MIRQFSTTIFVLHFEVFLARCVHSHVSPVLPGGNMRSFTSMYIDDVVNIYILCEGFLERLLQSVCVFVPALAITQ